jgi:hypothetical protein
MGRDVHQDASAVAYMAPEHGAAVLGRGGSGTRPWDLDQLLRTRPSNATHLLFGSDAGPCGAWRSQSLTHNRDDGWGVAPSLSPQAEMEAGTRRNTSGGCPPTEIRRINRRT